MQKEKDCEKLAEIQAKLFTVQKMLTSQRL